MLAFSPVPREGAGCRFRISQYMPALEAAGFDVTIAPFFDAQFFRTVYQPGQYAAKAIGFLRRTMHRIRTLATSGAYDLFFIYREAFPFGPPVIEALLGRFGRPIVYDFDDAIFLRNTSEANRFTSSLKYPQKVATIVSNSNLVVAGNEFLAEFARRFNPAVTVIPTCIDTELFQPRAAPRSAAQPLVVGWIGTPTTAPYVKTIAGALAAVAATHPYVFRVSGAAGPLAIDGLISVNEPWTLQREVELFATCDLGVYPLADDEWALGKCGFKAIQFMACGVPVVASPIGVNAEIIVDGVNGFLAATEREWIEKIGRLLEDADLRARLGAAGRRTIESRYSLAVNAPKMVEALERVTGRRVAERRTA
jgi:glycosyltransferase involved in cell wall biosynthesis